MSATDLDRALDVLLSAELAPAVDMVAWSPAPGRYEVASVDGGVSFRRAAGGYDVDASRGRNPLANQDPGWLSPLADERAAPFPGRADNAYPWAFEQFGQLFDHPSAPDLCVIHSAAHNWEGRGGHLGEHGSLGIVQARAPFVMSGPGVARLGLVERSCRLVDVAPTVLALLGAPAPAGLDGPVLDGRVLAEALDPDGRPDHVVAFLWDGTNANVLYDLAAAGVAPNVARLIENGVAYKHGAIASLPTVTLANHTTILTGRHPGHHGVLHNEWIDRVTGRLVVANSPATWMTAMDSLAAGVGTLHTMIKDAQPDACTVSINEPCDVGADHSVFDLLRRGERLPRSVPTHDDPAAPGDEAMSSDYRWGTVVDRTAVDQFLGVWGADPYLGRDWPAPRFSWVNFTLTDAAFHEGGPYGPLARRSVEESDARLGRMLDAVDAAGRAERTAFVLVADHGMQENDPAVSIDWDEALTDAGVPFTDAGYGFVYLAGA